MDQDFHVHSPYGAEVASTTEENFREAEWAGLRSICFVESASANSASLADMFEAVQSLRPMTDIEVFTGVEVDVVDMRGRLDVPASGDFDFVMISDHFLPLDDGLRSPQDVRSLIVNGTITTDDVISRLVETTVAAMGQVERAIIAHPFSFLKRLGIDESLITLAHLGYFAERACTTQTWVEVNEKWSCPGVDVIHELARLGVHLVAGSDSRSAAAVGAYRHVRRVHDSLKAHSSRVRLPAS